MIYFWIYGQKLQIIIHRPLPCCPLKWPSTAATLIFCINMNFTLLQLNVNSAWVLVKTFWTAYLIVTLWWHSRCFPMDSSLRRNKHRESCDLLELILDFKCEVRYHTLHRLDCAAHTECHQIHTSQMVTQKLLSVTDCCNTSEVKELLLHTLLQAVRLNCSRGIGLIQELACF